MLNVRVPSQLKQALRRAAADDHDRSVSAMVTRILGEWLAKRRYLAKRGRR